MKATPLISSTFASAVVFLLMKLAVMAMASFPRNSFRRNPAETEEWIGSAAVANGPEQLHFRRKTYHQLEQFTNNICFQNA